MDDLTVQAKENPGRALDITLELPGGGGGLLRFPGLDAFPAAGRGDMVYLDGSTRQAYYWEGENRRYLPLLSKAGNISIIDGGNAYD